MTPTASVPTTLSGLLEPIPADQTAVILPDQNVRVSYGELRRQVQDLAEALAAFGIGRGDRVGMALPNSLSTVRGVPRGVGGWDGGTAQPGL